MGYQEILQHVLTYIDEHITEPLSAEGLASVAGFSPFHFCHVFRWYVGYSVMEYVRGRRLAFAAADLSSGRRILDIALEFGFETHSGFSKAFRRHFGCPPETYRMHTRAARPSPALLMPMEKYQIGGIVMEPKWITLPAVRLAGYALKTSNKGGENNKAIPAFWLSYLKEGWMDTLHRQDFVKSHTEYGACFPENMETGEFEYLIGVEVKEGAKIPEGFEERVLPPATYAVFSTPPAERADFSPAIQGVWSYIYGEWFPNSGHEYTTGCVDFELYDERCIGDTGNVCDIYIPVTAKK